MGEVKTVKGLGEGDGGNLLIIFWQICLCLSFHILGAQFLVFSLWFGSLIIISVIYVIFIIDIVIFVIYVIIIIDVSICKCI